MRKVLAVFWLATAAGLLLASIAAARSIGWTAKLTAADVVPGQKVKNGTASGMFTATVVGYELHFKLTFKNLTGTATTANLGYGPNGKAGRLSILLCAPCKSPVTTQVGIDKSIPKAFRQHLLFVVVATAKNSRGEIRGQLG